MPSRYGWKGYLKLSLVSIPVKSFSAVSSQEGEIHFHQLHDQCHSRIKYVKTCPLHGAVAPNEIVSGYEYAKGQFVVMEPGELENLRGDNEKAVNVESIVPFAAVDPLYFTERSSYLVPDGPVGQKAYSLFEQCLSDRDAIAIARLVRNGKDEVVAIRSLQRLLVMTVLSNADQVKPPQAFADDVPKTDVSAAERKLTDTLFDAFQQDEIDLSQFKDHYTERVSELIEAKVRGKEIVAPTPSQAPDVINLMDALKKSVAAAKSGQARKQTLLAPKKPRTSNGRSPKRNSKTA